MCAAIRTEHAMARVFSGTYFPSLPGHMTTNNGQDGSARPTAAEAFAFTSELSEGRQRFLARALAHALHCARRTADDFVRLFPPSLIMQGLEHHPELRASILVATTGVREKIALRKSWQDAAADLELALEEGETNTEAVVELFRVDDRVRFLDARRIWAFLSEGEFWRIADADAVSAAHSQGHIAYLLESALEEGLVNDRDVVDALTVSELSSRLPRQALGLLLLHALQNADRGAKFTEADLLATTPPQVLVQYLPLSHIWDAVIRSRVAQRHGFEPAPDLATSLSDASSAPAPARPEGAGNVVPIALKAGAPSKQVQGAKLREVPRESSATKHPVGSISASKAVSVDPFDDDDSSAFELIEEGARAV
jgi:hypothetical protein